MRGDMGIELLSIARSWHSLTWQASSRYQGAQVVPFDSTRNGLIDCFLELASTQTNTAYKLIRAICGMTVVPEFSSEPEELLGSLNVLHDGYPHVLQDLGVAPGSYHSLAQPKKTQLRSMGTLLQPFNHQDFSPLFDFFLEDNQLVEELQLTLTFARSKLTHYCNLQRLPLEAFDHLASLMNQEPDIYRSLETSMVHHLALDNLKEYLGRLHHQYKTHGILRPVEYFLLGSLLSRTYEGLRAALFSSHHLTLYLGRSAGMPVPPGYALSWHPSFLSEDEGDINPPWEPYRAWSRRPHDLLPPPPPPEPPLPPPSYPAALKLGRYFHHLRLFLSSAFLWPGSYLAAYTFSR